MSDDQPGAGAPESRLSADSIAPSPLLDARVLGLAHLALLDARPPAVLGFWELSLSAALIASYAAYALEQALRILISS